MNATVNQHKIRGFVPVLNPLIKSMLRLGMPMGPMVLVTVKGRKSGRPHTTPVALMEHEGHRYILATFGDVNWVRNLRVAREAKIGRGRNRRLVSAVELPQEQAAVVFKNVLSPFLSSRMMSSFLRMGYDLKPSSTPADYMEEAKRHPAFELKG